MDRDRGNSGRPAPPPLRTYFRAFSKKNSRIFPAQFHIRPHEVPRYPACIGELVMAQKETVGLNRARWRLWQAFRPWVRLRPTGTTRQRCPT